MPNSKRKKRRSLAAKKRRNQLRKRLASADAIQQTVEISSISDDYEQQGKIRDEANNSSETTHSFSVYSGLSQLYSLCAEVTRLLNVAAYCTCVTYSDCVDILESASGLALFTCFCLTSKKLKIICHCLWLFNCFLVSQSSIINYYY